MLVHVCYVGDSCVVFGYLRLNASMNQYQIYLRITIMINNKCICMHIHTQIQRVFKP